MPASIDHQERMLKHLEGAQNLVRVKVRGGFYRCGALCIHKGHRWCVYDEDKLLSRHRTLDEAHWWAQHNQPRGS